MSDARRPTARLPLLCARASSALLVLLALAQTVLAGNFLGGQYDALMLHSIGARATTITSAMQIVILVWVWRTGGPRATVPAGVVQTLLLVAEFAAGELRMTAVHIPLGVLLTVGIVQLTTMIWRTPAAPATRRRSRAGDTVNRRTLLRWGLAAGGVGIVGVGWPLGQTMLGPTDPGRLLRSRAALPPPYRSTLPIPSRLSPLASDATTDYYAITQRVADLTILPSLTTRAWTYDGTFPGPTIVSRTGRRTVIRHHNALPVPVSVHLHGGHTPPDSDGYPLDLITPPSGGAPMGHDGMQNDMARNSVVEHRDYLYPMQQRAATLWYHDHRMGYTGEAVWRGLAGLHIVHDDEEDALPLPRGARDIPLMITDRSFAADGSFQYPAIDGGGVADPYMNGVLGDVVLVNGAPWPVLDTDPVRYRFRVLNASNARRYRLQLDPPPPGGSAFVQIGSDGGLLAGPVTHDAIDIAPAERFDVVVDFSRYAPGTRVRLINALGTQSAAEVMRFDIVGSDRSDESRVPELLSDGVVALERSRAVTTRTFLFGQGRAGLWTINNKPYKPGVSVATPRLGDVEIWRFITDIRHPIHVHLNHFQVLSRNGKAPGRYDRGWKDTVDVAPSEAVEVIVRFSGYHGTYLVHCHNLEHEDMAMMADFVTI